MPPIPLPQSTPWDKFKQKWSKGCGSEECSTQSKVVLARGYVPLLKWERVDVMFIGICPGDVEDLEGSPFVGPAGVLLDKIVERALPEETTKVFCNLVGCRPIDKNGEKCDEPDDPQVKKCKPRLEEFISICRPRLIVALGKTVQSWTEQGIKGNIKAPDNVEVLNIIHPSGILYRTTKKDKSEDQATLIHQCVVSIKCGWERVVNSSK